VAEIIMNLKHMLEPVDLMVATGLVATVRGPLLLFMSTQGSFQAAVDNDAVALEAIDIAQTAHE
jgi:hypothetical protein